MSFTWGMNPATLIQMIQAVCQNAEAIFSKDQTKKELTNRQIINKLKTPKSNMTN